ncbi:Putative ankyrin repeat-containing domain superfamily [Septoria linicola]|uniref:Ankyrin repeat-containing domain superfamily n=1 Tax=Septoria linicola TaxID=215465 RepID=A0A9Q9EQX8_9PEZI|nr:Putative ankyrin repeat-containing domain superfamily [Septoria linicola]
MRVDILGTLNHGQSRIQATNAYNALKAQIPDSVKVERALTSILQRQQSNAPTTLDDDSSRPVPIAPAPSLNTSSVSAEDSQGNSSDTKPADEQDSIHAEEALNELIPARAVAERLLELPPLRTRRIVEVSGGHDRAELDAFIAGYNERGQQALLALHFTNAEHDFGCAIAYSEQRQEQFGTPFTDRDLLLENLARAYFESKSWDIAIAIVAEELLHLDSDGHVASSDVSDKNVRAIARQRELLASFYFRRWRQDTSELNHWNMAHEHVQTARRTWLELEQDASGLTEDDLKRLRGCLQQLMEMHEVTNRDIEADRYRELLAQRRAHAHSISTLDSTHRRPSTTGSNLCPRFDEPMAEDALKSELWAIVEASDESQLRQLRDAAEEEWLGAVNDTTQKGETVLHFAVAAADRDMVVFLLSNGADIDALDDHGQTPLFRAIRSQRQDIVALLLQWDNRRVNTNSEHDGDTLLHEAVRRKDSACVELLLEANSDLLNRGGLAGLTALHYCAKHGLLDDAQLLIARGADVNAIDSQGRTPLGMALMRGDSTHQAVKSLLLANGASSDAQPLTRRATRNLAACDESPISQSASSTMSIRSDMSLAPTVSTHTNFSTLESLPEQATSKKSRWVPQALRKSKTKCATGK